MEIVKTILHGHLNSQNIRKLEEYANESEDSPPPLKPQTYSAHELQIYRLVHSSVIIETYWLCWNDATYVRVNKEAK